MSKKIWTKLYNFGAKYIYQKHHHKQEFVCGEEGPVGNIQGKLWHIKQVSQVMNINKVITHVVWLWLTVKVLLLVKIKLSM